MAYLTIKCDEIGYIRPTCGHPYEVVGTFLNHDVQRSGAACDYYTGHTRDVVGGAKPIEITGNAHDVAIFCDRVSLKNRYSDESAPVVLAPALFIEVLRFWKETVINWIRAGRPREFTARAEFVFPEVELNDES